MAVYKRTYKTYEGRLTPAWSRFSVVARYSFANLFKSRIFTAFTVLCLFPVLLGIAQIYLVHSATAQMLLDVRRLSIIKITNSWFAFFLQVEAWLGFLLAAAAAPGLVTRDFANHSLQLYFSRPLSRVEYLAGKITVLAALLSCTTWIPGLLLFALQAQLEGNGWGWNNAYLVGSIVLSSWLWIAVIALVTLALSVWVRWRIAATALIIGVFFLLPGFAQMVNLILGTRQGLMFSLPYTLNVAWMHLYRLDPRALHSLGMDRIPLLSAWITVITACLLSLLLLNARLQAREVERG